MRHRRAARLTIAAAAANGAACRGDGHGDRVIAERTPVYAVVGRVTGPAGEPVAAATRGPVLHVDHARRDSAVLDVRLAPRP